MALLDFLLDGGDDEDEEEEEYEAVDPGEHPPPFCLRCGATPWWDHDEESWCCHCGYFSTCDTCGQWPQWDDEEEAWECDCGYDFT